MTWQVTQPDDSGGYKIFDPDGNEVGVFRNAAVAASHHAVLAQSHREQKKILATLPKIGQLVGEGDEQRIVWDVPIVPEMPVWRTSMWQPVKGPVKGDIDELTVYQIRPLTWDALDIIENIVTNIEEADCYSTRAAAEFAIEKARNA